MFITKNALYDENFLSSIGFPVSVSLSWWVDVNEFAVTAYMSIAVVFLSFGSFVNSVGKRGCRQLDKIGEN